MTVNKQNPIYLKCEASGYPVPTVTWTKDGGPVQSAVGGVIRIDSSTKSHSGAYICFADNGVGRADQIKTFVTVNCK